MKNYKDKILATLVAVFFFVLGFSKGIVLHEKAALIDHQKEAFVIAVDDPLYLPKNLTIDFGSEIGRPIEVQSYGSSENLEQLLNSKNPPDLILAPQSYILTMNFEKLQDLPAMAQSFLDSKDPLVDPDFLKEQSENSIKSIPFFWGYSLIKSSTSVTENLSLKNFISQKNLAKNLDKAKIEWVKIGWPVDFYQTCNWLQFLEINLPNQPIESYFQNNKVHGNENLPASQDLISMIPHTSEDAGIFPQEGSFLWIRALIVPKGSPFQADAAKIYLNKDLYLKWLLSTPAAGTFHWLNAKSNLKETRKPQFIRQQNLKNFRRSESCPKRFWINN